MQAIQSDIKILDNLVALNLEINLWSARRKMTPDDFGGANLPPDDLATLGSKRIADPEQLKIFNTLKARAFSYLDRHGVRFMSGWAIPEDKANMIIEELVKIRKEFLAAKDEFLSQYETFLDNWIQKHGAWATIIKNSTVGADYVRARLSFRWQLYKVSPVVAASGESASLESGLADEVTGLGQTLFGEVARSADEIWKKVYMGKTEVTHKALSPLRALREKLIGLSFVEPHVAPVAEIIQTAIKKLPPKGNITGSNLVMLQGLVCLLRDSKSLALHSQKLIEGYGPATVLDALMETPVEMANKPESSENSHEEPQMEEPLLPDNIKASAPVMSSMGLW